MIYLVTLLIVSAGAVLTYAKALAAGDGQSVFERYRPLHVPTVFVLVIFPLAIEHPDRPVITFVLMLNAFVACLNLAAAASFFRDAKAAAQKRD